MYKVTDSGCQFGVSAKVTLAHTGRYTPTLIRLLSHRFQKRSGQTRCLTQIEHCSHNVIVPYFVVQSTGCADSNWHIVQREYGTQVDGKFARNVISTVEPRRPLNEPIHWNKVRPMGSWWLS